MLKLIPLALLLTLICSYNYPLYKQCDSRWGSDKLGTSPTQTICSAGCLMSSAAMALKGFGQEFDPKSLNIWLTNNGGYVSGDLFVWASINRFGVTFKGFIANNQIKANLDSGNIVIVNVRNGGHWVLVTGISGDTITVNDAGYSVSSYNINDVVNGNTGIYTVNKLPNFLNNWLISTKQFLLNIIGYQQQIQTPPIAVLHDVSNIRQE